MPNFPNASEIVHLRHYDLTMWVHEYQEWVPRGERLTWEEAVSLLEIKRGVSRSFSWRIILVQGTISNMDMTEMAEREIREKKNVGSNRTR